jgi:hypothetical protein
MTSHAIDVYHHATIHPTLGGWRVTARQYATRKQYQKSEYQE